MTETLGSSLLLPTRSLLGSLLPQDKDCHHILVTGELLIRSLVMEWVLTFQTQVQWLAIRDDNDDNAQFPPYTKPSPYQPLTVHHFESVQEIYKWTLYQQQQQRESHDDTTACWVLDMTTTTASALSPLLLAMLVDTAMQQQNVSLVVLLRPDQYSIRQHGCWKPTTQCRVVTATASSSASLDKEYIVQYSGKAVARVHIVDHETMQWKLL